MKRKTKKPLTRLNVPSTRQDIALVTLFKAGFTPSEIAALLRRSEPMVMYVLRQSVLVSRPWL